VLASQSFHIFSSSIKRIRTGENVVGKRTTTTKHQPCKQCSAKFAPNQKLLFGENRERAHTQQ